MQTRCNPKLAGSYTSRAQIARVVTESWGAANLFCAACSSDELAPARTGTSAYDFSCQNCSERYQLKSMRRWSDYRVLDSGYAAMIRAIRADETPNLLLMHYSDTWHIERLLLIPRFFFTESVIEKRNPLALTARRAGWIGCNILIGGIPADGKIPVIENKTCVPAVKVRARYKKVSALEELPVSLRGWTLDVLRCVRQLPTRFALSDVYRFERELQQLHPDNRHVRDKIRQQLQVLRDIGFLRFVSAGRYQSK
jgi:type II restriction enzyme